VPAHADIEAAFASLDAGLLLHAGVGAVDLALVVAGADLPATGAEGRIDARALVLARVVVRVLLAGHRQVAANVRNDGFAAGLRAFQRGVAAADQSEGVGRIHRGFGMGSAVAVALALGRTGADVHADARLAAEGDADLAAAGLVALDLLAGLLLRLQQQVPRRRQRHVVAFDLAAGDGEVAAIALAVAGSVDHHVAFAGDAAAGGGGGVVFHRTGTLAGTDADAQAQAVVARSLGVPGGVGKGAKLVAGSLEAVHSRLPTREQRLPRLRQVQRRQAVVLHLAGTIDAVLHRHRGVHRTPLQADVDARLPELLRLGDAVGILRRLDRHVLADDADALAAEHVAAGDPVSPKF